jgi:hypothetical protein
MPPAPPVLSGAATLGYEAAPSEDDLAAHPWRNVWFPTLFLIGGLLATFLWVHFTITTRGAFVLFWFVVAASAFTVTAVFVAYGLLFARKLERTTASFMTAAVKVLSILAITDALVLWVWNYLVWVGVIARHMSGVRLIEWLFFFCVVAIIKAASYCLFNTQDDDFVAAGFPLACLAWLGHFAFAIVIIFVLAGIAHAAKQSRTTVMRVSPAAPAPAVTTRPTTSAPAGPGALAATPADQAIVKKILSGIEVKEAREWKQSRFKKDPSTDALVDHLYAAGAKRVYVDELSMETGRARILYAELPSDPKIESDCEKAYLDYAKQNNIPPKTTRGETRRFMVIELGAN